MGYYSDVAICLTYGKYKELYNNMKQEDLSTEILDRASKYTHYEVSTDFPEDTKDDEMVIFKIGCIKWLNYGRTDDEEYIESFLFNCCDENYCICYIGEDGQCVSNFGDKFDTDLLHIENTFSIDL